MMNIGFAHPIWVSKVLERRPEREIVFNFVWLGDEHGTQYLI